MDRGNTRSFKTSFMLTRAQGDNNGEMVVEGYFAVYEQETMLWKDIFEVIKRGAFDEAVGGDVCCLWNHQTQLVLGRSLVKTLELRSDSKGLWGRVVFPNTSYAKDLYELISRGDVSECSFGFDVLKETIVSLENGGVRFEMEKIALFEVSIVTFAQYDGTGIEAREKQLQGLKAESLRSKKLEIKQKLEGLKRC